MGKVKIGYVGFNKEHRENSTIQDSPEGSFFLQSDGKISINHSVIKVNSLCDSLNFSPNDVIGIGIEVEDKANAFVTYNGEVIFSINDFYKEIYKEMYYYPAITVESIEFKYEINTGTAAAFKYSCARELHQNEDKNKDTEKIDKDRASIFFLKYPILVNY